MCGVCVCVCVREREGGREGDHFLLRFLQGKIESVYIIGCVCDPVSTWPYRIR